ncbi:MAG: hypothetical protein L0H29_05450, partial [Sinobacteraceae bacterium]|nr:hypothetical protein [Nevskiaceae bacterium]
HNRVILVNRKGQVQSVFGDGCAGHRDGDAGETRFNRPHGLAFHDGALWVADTGGHLIRRIALGDDTTTTVAGNGQRAYVRSGSFAPLKATLNSPWDLAWYGGMLYISMAGNHQIWRLDPKAGQIGPWAGTGAEGLRDGPIDVATFAQPSGMVVHDNVLYETDPESSSLRAINLAAGDKAQVKTLVGQALFQFGLKNGPADDALLQHDEAVAWAGGNLYIADTFNNALRRLDLKTQTVSTVAKLDRPLALATLGKQQLLVASGNGIRVVDLTTGSTSAWPVHKLTAPPASICHKP